MRARFAPLLPICWSPPSTDSPPPATPWWSLRDTGYGLPPSRALFLPLLPFDSLSHWPVKGRPTCGTAPCMSAGHRLPTTPPTLSFPACVGEQRARGRRAPWFPIPLPERRGFGPFSNFFFSFFLVSSTDNNTNLLHHKFQFSDLQILNRNK